MPAAVRLNKEAASHHATVTCKGPDAGASADAATTLDAARRHGGGGANPKHPHLFHLASAAGSTYPGGNLQGAIAGNWSTLAGQQGFVHLARVIARKPGFEGGAP